MFLKAFLEFSTKTIFLSKITATMGIVKYKPFNSMPVNRVATESFGKNSYPQMIKEEKCKRRHFLNNFLSRYIYLSYTMVHQSQQTAKSYYFSIYKEN